MLEWPDWKSLYLTQQKKCCTIHKRCNQTAAWVRSFLKKHALKKGSKHILQSWKTDYNSWKVLLHFLSYINCFFRLFSIFWICVTFNTLTIQGKLCQVSTSSLSIASLYYVKLINIFFNVFFVLPCSSWNQWHHWFREELQTVYPSPFPSHSRRDGAMFVFKRILWLWWTKNPS